MKMTAFCAAAIAAGLAASPVAAASRTPPGAPVPSVHVTKVPNWIAYNDRELYIDAGRQWYEADVARPCWGLSYANRVKLAMPVPGTFDTSSSVLVGHERCPVRALFRVDRPSAPLMAEGEF